MMIRHRRPRVGRAVAVLGCAAALAGVASAPAAATAGTTAHSCGSRSITIPVKGGKPVKKAVSRIRAEGGATCAEAVKVIRGASLHELPPGWKVSRGNFDVPNGLVAQQAVNKHKRVTWAQPGT